MFYFIIFMVGGLFVYFVICLFCLMAVAKIADKLLEADKETEKNI